MKSRTLLLLALTILLCFLLFRSLRQISPPAAQTSQPTVQTSQPAVYVRRTSSGEITYGYRGHSGELSVIIPLLGRISVYGENIQLLIFVQKEVDVGSLLALLKELRRIKWKEVVINDLIVGVLKDEISCDGLFKEDGRAANIDAKREVGTQAQ